MLWNIDHILSILISLCIIFYVVWSWYYSIVIGDDDASYVFCCKSWFFRRISSLCLFMVSFFLRRFSHALITRWLSRMLMMTSRRFATKLIFRLVSVMHMLFIQKIKMFDSQRKTTSLSVTCKTCPKTRWLTLIYIKNIA